MVRNETWKYNLTFVPPPTGWGKRNQLREENSKFIRNGRGKKEAKDGKERKRGRMEEEEGKGRKKGKKERK